ncbi:MAG: hypothetical protein ACP5D2_03505 [Candidatus Nanoarchaeia archaeon]
MELIALISTGKGTWGQVSGLMRRGEWENIILLGPDYAKDFSVNDTSGAKVGFDFIEFSSNKPLITLRNDFSKKLAGKIKGTEVAVSIASGTGKEHMALLSSLLSLPVGVRFTALTKDGIVFI